MGSVYSLKLADYGSAKAPGGEMTHVNFPGTNLTAANFDAQNTLMDSLRTAVQGIIVGKIADDKRIAVVSHPETPHASVPAAQRENKWLCRYHDASTGERFSLSIGTADLTKLAANSEQINLGAGAGAAFKTAFEAYVKIEKDDGSFNNAVLDSVTFAGRNL